MAVTGLVAEFLRTADRDLSLPAFSVQQLLAAFQKFNIKVGTDGKPASAGMWRAIDYLESRLDGPSSGPCECCGTNF
jgi:hypothetical protein